MNKNIVLVSGAIVFREKNGKIIWFLSKKKDSEEWEIPKVIVRKGESSVRAALRMMGEKGGMNTRVLEEAGRAGGTATVNGRVISQRYIYYLMILRNGSTEAIGFESYEWLDCQKAIKELASKREKTMLKQARQALKIWEKQREKRNNLEQD